MALISITFDGEPVAGDIITFAIARRTDLLTKAFKPETYQDTISLDIGEIQTETGYVPAGRASAIEYERRWRVHYARRFWLQGAVVTRDNNIVQIRWDVDEEGEEVYWISDFSSTNVLVEGYISNGSVIQTFDEVETLLGTAVVPCNNFELSIETNEVAPEIWLYTGLNGVQLESSNVANPYIFDVPRDQLQRVKLINATGDIVWIPNRLYKPYMVAEFNPATFNIDIKVSLSGATLTAQHVPIYSLTPNPTTVFTYSLDDISYQSSPIFTAQPTGVGTMYVLDAYGCKNSKTYEVAEADVPGGGGTRVPFLYISDANAINFIEQEVVDGCSIYRNDNNALTHQGLEDVIFCEQIPFQTCDSTTIQFKSNYRTPTVFLRNEDGSADIELQAFQRTANLNRFQRLDAWYYNYSDEYLGIYFTNGSTYDDQHIELVGEEFNLNGNLPDLAQVGVIINIDVLGAFEIKQVVFDASIQKKVILIEKAYAGAPTPTIVEAYYDLLNYEVYEFAIDWSTHGEGLYDIYINNADPNNTTVEHLSENILIQDVHENTLAIRYYNDNNRDVFYKYGIEHFIRVPYLHIEGVPLDETKINITDLTSSVTESSLHKVDKFYFDGLSKNAMWRLSIALSLENVFINGIGYIKKGNLETENEKHTNNYLVSAEMLRTNINYNNNRQGQQGLDEDNINFDIEPFIFGEDGFIKS